MTRRECIALLPAGLAAAPAIRGLHTGCQTNAWKINPSQFPDLLSALGAIRSLGFEGFETGFRNVQEQFGQAAVARSQLSKTGLRFFATHIFLDQYDPRTSIAPFDLIIRVAEGAAALGSERLILSGAPVGTAVSEKAAALNRAGEFCRTKKLRLAYHNHSPEFTNGAAEIQALMGATDGERVHFVIDAGHAMRTGVNLAEFFSRYRDRIDGLHLRDFRDDLQVPLGSGSFDYQPLAAAVKKAKWGGWVLAEEERLSGEKPGATAAGPARETIRRLFGV